MKEGLHRRSPRVPRLPQNAAIAAVALLAVVPALAQQKEAPEKIPVPETFGDFKAALAHAREKEKLVFIACTKTNHPDSFKLARLVARNEIYLSPDKIAVYTYEVEDEARLATFKQHFKVASGDVPIVVITDSRGVPKASRAGLASPVDYVAWVQTVAGEDAVEIPAEGMFGVREGDLAGSVDLTEMRTWTTVTGQKITAVLTEARGAMGIFRSDGGKMLEIGFNTLSAADIAYLKNNNVLEMK